jgi:hypothetical protein
LWGAEGGVRELLWLECISPLGQSVPALVLWLRWYGQCGAQRVFPRVQVAPVQPSVSCPDGCGGVCLSPEGALGGGFQRVCLFGPLLSAQCPSVQRVLPRPLAAGHLVAASTACAEGSCWPRALTTVAASITDGCPRQHCPPGLTGLLGGTVRSEPQGGSVVLHAHSMMKASPPPPHTHT